MDLTNIVRNFGSDALLVTIPAVPLLALFVFFRARRLRRGGAAAPTSAALAEAVLIGYGAAVAAVTMIPQDYGSEQSQRFDWSAWTSDLTYAADRTQVIANVVLLMPLVALALVRFWSGRPLRAGIALSLALPAAIELAQGSVIPGRVAALEDVLVGSAGGLVATLATALLLSQLRRRDAGTAPASGGAFDDINSDAAPTGLTTSDTR